LKSKLKTWILQWQPTFSVTMVHISFNTNHAKREQNHGSIFKRDSINWLERETCIKICSGVNLCTLHFSTSHETSNLNRDHLLEYKHHQSTKIIKISSWHNFFVWFLLGILSHSNLSSLPSQNAKVNGQFHSLQRGKCESRELKTRTFACFTKHSWEHNPSLSIYLSCSLLWVI